MLARDATQQLATSRNEPQDAENTAPEAVHGEEGDYVPDGQETLQELVDRRRREIGGRTGPISVRQVHQRGGGDEHWSYEIVRKIVERGHSNIGDRIADRLAIALDIPVSRIHTAAGQRQRGTPFVLPARANRLSQTEREIVRAVIDGFLGAYSEDRPELPTQRRARGGAPRFDLAEVEGMRLAEPGSMEQEQVNGNGDTQ